MMMMHTTTAKADILTGLMMPPADDSKETPAQPVCKWQMAYSGHDTDSAYYQKSAQTSYEIGNENVGHDKANNKNEARQLLSNHVAVETD